MSPHAVNTFVSDLVQMAQAMEELPKAQAELAEARAEIERQRQHNQGLELNIAGYKADIEGLNARNHKLEAERDDAELRFLECEDKFLSLTSAVKGIAAVVGMVDKPEPAVVEHEPMPVDGEYGASVQQSPIASTDAAADVHTNPASETSTSVEPVAALIHDEALAVANPPDPTAHSTAGDGPSSGDAQSVRDIGSASTDDAGKYAGKRYADSPVYVSYRDWMKGGGSEYDYWDH